MVWTRDSRKDAPEPVGRDSVATAERERRLQAEESLRESEEVFRLLVEGVRDYAIFMLDSAGRVATWNLGAERIKGYSAEEVIGQHFSLFYQEKDVVRGWPEYELKVAATEGRFEDEGWRVRKDGSLFWANVIITAVYDGGRLCGFSKVTRDLTERRRTEEELRQARDLLEVRVEERTAELTHTNARLEREIEERKHAEKALRGSEQRLRSLMELMPVAVYMCEAPSGVIQYYNRCAAEVWGREPALNDTEERFCGSYRLRWPDGSPLPHVATPMAEVLGGGPPVRNRKVVIEQPNGNLVTALVNIDPITSDTGQVVGAINVFQDVTERERLFEALQQSEERFRRLVFALPAAVYTTDREGRITLFNDHAVELWGRQPEIGKDLWCGSHRIFRPDGTPLPHDQCPMAITLREGRVVRGEEILVERPDGSRAWVLPYPELLRNSAGEIIGAVNMLVDITDRKRAEEELLKRSVQIEKLVQELAVADRRKNEFLATLAHELRNPLAPIRHALQILHIAPDPAIQRQTLGVIDRQLGQMVRLVDDLLDISRITNNKLRLRKERIELAEAIQSALETTRPFIEGAGHELTVLLPPEPVYVEADMTRLAQVFINLLNNSAKYTEKGGHIRLAVEMQGPEVAVSVRDTGIGITAEHLPHLFEMFSQAAPALERSGGGLGIGLALARGVVELHGGSIEARSEGLGKGSEITVRLPVAPAPDQKQPQLSGDETEARRGSRCRVLIADDNRDSADSLSLLLKLAGYETWTAHDGLEAVQAAMAHNPDVALLDIGMPKISGYEVARRIRQEPWGQRMLLVAITGWGQDDDKQQAREAGFDHHLTKPVDLADLRVLLEKAAQGR